MAKKILSWVLALVMVCSMLPVNAMATLADAGLDKPIVQSESSTVINPLYADMVTLEDLVQPSGEETVDPNDVSEDEYATTYEEAAAQLREGLKLRQESIEVYYRTENYDFNTDYPAIWEESLTHTGVPTEGDYLKWVWAGYKAGASGYSSGNVYYLTFTYTVTYHSTAEQEAELDEAVETLLSDLNPTGTDYQKLKMVYDYICANITYDNDSEDTLKYTAYAALVNKTAVCQGYATLLYRLALEIGIDIRLISGTGNGGDHGWNIVELNDVYYNVDSTWDATWMQQVGYYNYFLQCEDTFTEGGTDHIRSEEYDTAEFHAAYPMSESDFNPETDDVLDTPVSSLGALTVGSVNALETTSGEGWSFDPATDTLTLSGADITSEDYGIYAEGDLTIVGTDGTTNTVTGGPASIYVDGDLTITGCCLNAANTMEYADVQETYGHVPCGIAAIGSLTVTDSAIVAEGTYMGMYGKEELTLIGSDITTTGLMIGLACSTGTLIIDSTVLYAAATTSTDGELINPPAGRLPYGIVSENGQIVIRNSSQVTAYSVAYSVVSSGDLLIMDSDVDATSMCYALVTNSVLSISGNSTVHAMSKRPEDYTGSLYENAYSIGGGTGITLSDNLFADKGTYGVYNNNYTYVDADGLPVLEITIQPLETIASGACGTNLTWVLTNDGTLTISGEGEMSQYDGENTPWYGYRNDILSLIVEDGVTSIGDFAFYYCENLKTVSLPDSLSTIGGYAFYECSALTSVVIPDSVTSIGTGAFVYCSALAHVELSEGLTSLPNELFADCTSLTSITIPAGITKIYWGLFDGCTSLAEIVIAEGNTSFRYEDGFLYTTEEAATLIFASPCLISGEVVVPEGVAYIYGYAFSCCAGMTAITLPDTVTRIGQCAFRACSGLESLTIPESATTIDTAAFQSCTNLKEIKLPSELKYVTDGMFSGCTSLESIELPAGLLRISMAAFRDATSLKCIVIPASVTSVEWDAFNNCTSLEEITFKGDFPQITDDIFGNVEAVAYYPEGNTTWTSDVMQDYGGTITWAPYSEIEDEPIVITSQPADFVGLVGDMATFTVVAEGEDLSYQWYFSKDSGTTWETASSKTSSISLEFKAYRLGYMYRCEITDVNGNTVVSDPATMCAEEVELAITSQPVSYVGAVNDEVSFVVEATGNGLVYEWFFSEDYGETWAKSYSPGYQTNTLAPILRAHRDGNMYQCVVTDVFGNSVTSDAVSMEVESSEITIVEEPQSIENGVLGQLYQFTVVAEGENLTYRWEYSDDGGETWQESWNQGYNSATLNVRLNANRDGNQYRCIVTSGLKEVWVTSAAILDLQDPSAEIISQSSNVSVIAGTTATFTVEAEGMDLTYLWYRSDDKGATWNQTYLSGYNTNTLSFEANTNRAAMYMCKVTDGSGKAVWSDPVKLQILSAELKILTQPVSVTCAAGDTAVFTVEVQGDSLTYQWYASSDGGETWTASYLTGYNTAEFSFVVNTTRAAKLYKCMITDVSGNTVETNAVSVEIVG